MNRKKRGLTLVEILVATLIMSITMAGLVNLFVSSKRWLLHSRARMTGGELGKYFLDPSSNAIVESAWDNSSGDYVAGNQLRKRADSAGTNVTLDRQYSPTYTVTTISGFPADSQPRKMKVTVTWNEPNI